jgi:hypothetical protein
VTVTAPPVMSISDAGLGVGTISTQDTGDWVFVDASQVTWGRSSVLEQPTPSTATVRVLDRSYGATLARRTDLIGAQLLLGYGVASSYVLNFRGRITDVDVTRRPEGGFYVALAASSREVEAANYTVPDGASWPAETFAQRRDRIVGLVPRELWRTGDVTLPLLADVGWPAAATDLDGLVAAAVTPSGDALTLLRELFASMSPLPMVYRPQTDTVGIAPRRLFAPTAGGQTAAAGLVLGPAGRYVAAPLSVGGLAVDAFDVDAGSARASQPLDSRITRVEVTYAPNLTAAAATSLPEANGRRTLALSSIHNTAAGGQQLANIYADVAGREGAAPRLDPVGYSTARNGGGFASAGVRDALLAGIETATQLLLGRSWFTGLGIRPQVGIIGGTITYAGGQWLLQLRPAPAVVTDPAWAPVPVKYAGRSTVKLSDVDASVTFGDAAFIDVGAGYTAATQPPYGGPAT